MTSTAPTMIGNRVTVGHAAVVHGCTVEDDVLVGIGAVILDIDGVRVMTPEGWWLLRASNTQNVLTTRVEADSPESLEQLKNMLIKEVEKIGYSVTFP